MPQFPVLAAALLMTGLVACTSSQQPAQPTGNPTAADGSAPMFTEEEKAAMTSQEKAAIYNQTAVEKDRVVCRREKPVGSHMPRTICRTVAEIEADREAAQESMRQDRVNPNPVPGVN